MITSYKKNGWFFGDSFTWGQGCRPKDAYYQFTINNIGKRWSEIICDTYNLKEINLGKNGASNPYIINTIIENIKNIKSGDFVFIGKTIPMRTMVTHMKKREIVTFTDLVDVNKVTNTEEQKEILINYIYEFIIPFEKEWEEYYSKQYLNLSTIIKDKGASVLIWNHTTWSDYETIREYTSGKIDDGHWTWESHKLFSEWVLGNLNSNLI